MKRGRVFVNSVFHNMWGEFDVISHSLFLGKWGRNPRKNAIILRISYIFSTFARKLSGNEERISDVGKDLQGFRGCSCERID